MSSIAGANGGISVEPAAKAEVLDAAPGGVGKPPKLDALATGLPFWPLTRLDDRCCAMAIRSAAFDVALTTEFVLVRVLAVAIPVMEVAAGALCTLSGSELE
mmetsp:Transcript_8826/g.19063  ORF Transcript_8826/g.19063 Transcript_8826/m.19063 type:complete len:102 (-) Transcript_8826:313-618(-)